LKKGEATKEDIDELQGFVLEGVDLYENEPTELHPLYWNHSSGRWDDHPQSVEKEMARVHEESLRIEAVVPSVVRWGSRRTLLPRHPYPNLMPSGSTLWKKLLAELLGPIPKDTFLRV
jgi:hypothetical protein